MGAPERITLGTRGSDLALAQSKLVEQALRTAWPDLEVRTEIIRTSGDEGAQAEVRDRKAGCKGLFTHAIEEELLVRRIDLAVHSAKDLPSERAEELEVRAALPRADVRDVLITKTGTGLTNLPAGSIIGTGSVRRQHQLRWQRPELQVADLRGNVPTRLRKLHENENWSGIILARAGLERLGMEIVGRALRLPRIENEAAQQAHDSGQPKRSPYNAMSAEILSPEIFLPAGGQGIIALQLRRDDEHAQRLVEAINHSETLTCLRAEREFLRLLDGDCDSPVGVHASVAGRELILQAQVFCENEGAPEAGQVRSAAGKENPEMLAAALYNQIYGEREGR